MSYAASTWSESQSQADSAEIKRLVAGGESSLVELKARIPLPEVIARAVAAFANSEGGVLLIGVEEPASFVGVDHEHVRRVLERSIESLLPIPDITLESVGVDGKAISVIRVRRSSGLVAVRGTFFLRVGSQIRVLTAPEIKRHVSEYQSPDRALVQLSEAVARQSTEIERLRADFARANSLRKKVGIAVVGAAVGALLKVVVEHLW